MLTTQQVAVIKAMLSRGDKQHDIAAHFGVNGGRIAEIANGQKFGDVRAASTINLPPLTLTGAPEARFVNPKAPLKQQHEQLEALIKQPPENTRVVTFSPELAEWILTNRNDNNRRMRPGKIRRFAEAMQAGNWGLTGDTIKFGKSGVLLDGQNRLRGCVRAAVPLKTHVAFGIDDKLFAVMDRGANRTPPDVFQIAGVPYPTVAAQAVRWLMIHDQGSQNRGMTIEGSELYSYYKKVDLERFEEAVKRALQVPKKIIPHGNLVAHLYLFEGKSSKATQRFASDLAHQVRGGRTLIKKLDKLRRQHLGRVHENQTNALIILAWQAYRKGVGLTASMLNWTETKEYPTID